MAKTKPKSKKKGLGKHKACKMLHDKKVRGRPLTDKQRRKFGAICSGQPERKAR